jgi:hypothetical protein
MEDDGTTDIGGLNSYTFAKDGETSYSDRHPTWASALFAHNGTPVADMLVHSPPLPLVIDYHWRDGNLIEEDEEEIILALEQRERIRYIRFTIPVLNLQKLVISIDEEYPTLEYLILAPLDEDDTSLTLILPKTLQAAPNWLLQATHILRSTSAAVYEYNRELQVRPCRVRVLPRASLCGGLFP